MADVSLVPTMTGYNAPTPIVITESGYINNKRFYLCFDGTGAGYLQTDGVPTEWGKIDAGAGVKWRVNSYKIKGYSAGAYPSAWILQGSNDGTNWTTVDTVSGHATDALTTFTVDTPGSYRYYRFTNWNYSGVLWKQVELWGYVAKDSGNFFQLF